MRHASLLPIYLLPTAEDYVTLCMADCSWCNTRHSSKFIVQLALHTGKEILVKFTMKLVKNY